MSEGGLAAADVGRWIFGYGSLVWRPDFEYSRSCVGFFARLVTPILAGVDRSSGGAGCARPSRDVGPRPLGVVAGVALISWGPRDKRGVLTRLDQREQQGYVRMEVELSLCHPDSGTGHEKRFAPAAGLVYIATSDNKDYLGAAAMSAIAQQVMAARGPSGPNLEYVLKLAEALRAVGAEDAHVEELVAALRACQV